MGGKILTNEARNFPYLIVSNIFFFCFISLVKSLLVANKIRNFTINVAFRKSNEVKILVIYTHH